MSVVDPVADEEDLLHIWDSLSQPEEIKEVDAVISLQFLMKSLRTLN